MNRRWSGGALSDPPEESFDVLLQLTFPITLILAFIVVMELHALKQQYDAFAGTPQAVFNSYRQQAILSLQEQLLLKAVREVFQKQSAELELPQYQASMPTPDQVIDRSLPPDFVAATRALYQDFGTPTKRTEMTKGMRTRSLEHYKELVDQQAISNRGLGEVSLNELRQVAPANETKLDNALAGEMANLARSAEEPQLDLIEKWIRSQKATDASGESIRQAWQNFLNASKSEKKTMSDKFVNLKVLALQDMLRELNAPLQENAVHDVL